MKDNKDKIIEEERNSFANATLAAWSIYQAGEINKEEAIAGIKLNLAYLEAKIQEETRREAIEVIEGMKIGNLDDPDFHHLVKKAGLASANQYQAIRNNTLQDLKDKLSKKDD